MDNTIAHNIVSGYISVGAGVDPFNDGQSLTDVTIKQVRVRDNEVSGSQAFASSLSNHGDRNVLTDLTIARNIVFGNREGISVRNGWQYPFDPTMTALPAIVSMFSITDNIVTGNTVPTAKSRDGISIYGGFNYLFPYPVFPPITT